MYLRLFSLLYNTFPAATEVKTLIVNQKFEGGGGGYFDKGKGAPKQ